MKYISSAALTARIVWHMPHSHTWCLW